MSTFRPHVEKAIGLYGSQAKLAAEMGCSQQYISWLLKDADQVSAEMAVAFERVTSGQVSRSDLRPDLFPAPVTEKAGA